MTISAPVMNQLLAGLTLEDMSTLEQNLRTVELKQGDTLARPGDDIETIYFPHSGIVSFLVDVNDGDVVQTGMVGFDGAVGVAQATGDKVSLNRIVVQLAGTASAIDRAPFRDAVASRSGIRKMLAAHEQFLIADIQQTAACNALHPVEARICRWLLRMTDLVGTEIPITHEHLATMIGVRRNTVTAVATRLQNDGLISYSRGQVRIRNPEGLGSCSCDCHEAVRRNYRRLFGLPVAVPRLCQEQFQQ
jgi:CRP-like cAMP-binding protein